MCCHYMFKHSPDIKIHGANMGPIWGRQDPGGPHVGPMNFAIWEYFWQACICFMFVDSYVLQYWISSEKSKCFHQLVTITSKVQILTEILFWMTLLYILCSDITTSHMIDNSTVCSTVSSNSKQRKHQGCELLIL